MLGRAVGLLLLNYRIIDVDLGQVLVGDRVFRRSAPGVVHLLR